MAKRFYLATREDRSAQAGALLEALKAGGWERTFEWSAEDDAGPKGYRQALNCDPFPASPLSTFPDFHNQNFQQVKLGQYQNNPITIP